MTEVLVRRGEAGDLPAVAEVFLASRAAAVPSMPPVVATDDEVRADFAALDLHDPARREVWVAESSSGLLGYAKLKANWLDDLYVVPSAQRQGIGLLLLDLVKSLRPNGFSLWAFASNEPARRFYARQGLLELETTDGSQNQEHAPDVRMVWPGPDPVAFLRQQIDEVDDDLGRLLARRVALTAAVQDHKPVGGHEGRDPAREREIAQRMSRHAPDLGADRLGRIVHTIISESLDAR